MIDKNSPVPVYYQVKEEIKRKILTGMWKVGQCIDSERELSELYNISRMTVRQAIGELVQEGMLIREKGKGTFVCEPKVKQKDIMSFSEIVRKRGLSAETEVLQFQRIHTPITMQEILLFEEVYKINRLRIVEGERVANEIVYIPCDYCGQLTTEQLQGSLYEILARYGYRIDHSEASIQAVLMDEDYMDIFKVTFPVPLLKSSSMNFTADGRLLFIEESVYRSDKYTLEVNIFRREGRIL